MGEMRQSFCDFLRELSMASDGSRQNLVDGFMSSVASTPLLEKDCFAHFLYRGEAGSVAIPCDANEWSPIDFPMQRVPATNLWYFTRRFEPDARLDYKLLINGSDWILDPCNPHRIEGGYGLNSELRMPKYSLPQN